MLMKPGKNLLIMLLITISLVGCQNLNDAFDDTNEKLVFNENVTLETLDSIKIGGKELVKVELPMRK